MSKRYLEERKEFQKQHTDKSLTNAKDRPKNGNYSPSPINKNNK
jgi:hypothetical protein